LQHILCVALGGKSSSVGWTHLSGTALSLVGGDPRVPMSYTVLPGHMPYAEQLHADAAGVQARE
jgi:hypothetical protein